MSRRPTAYYVIALLATLLHLSSCNYELCYDHPHTGDLRVVFD